MKRVFRRVEQLKVLAYLAKWFALTIPLAFLVGSMVALFLWLLDLATRTRWENPWLLFLLPLAGVIIVWVYRVYGKNSSAGNNLVMDEIHKPGGGVPARMAPLVLVSTVLTHLFGGSAGREGTAVQMGGSMAAFLARVLRVNKEDTRVLLMAGVAAGFGSVFGTPVAGAIFALEVLTVGRLSLNAMAPCFFASVLANLTCSMWGIGHTAYALSYTGGVDLLGAHSFDAWLWAKVLLAGVLFGLASYFFAELSGAIKTWSARLIKINWLIPFVGGSLVIALVYILDTRDYLGLGVTTFTDEGVSIVNAFREGGAEPFSWFWKLLFTAITLGTGFKGGEVTPLFFIGATLGNTLAWLTNAPVDLFAALGFIAVFAGATNTPLACTIMGVELFGGEHVGLFALACFTAYYFSGTTGIYGSQRLSASKTGRPDHAARDRSLGEFRANLWRRFWQGKGK